MGQDIRNVWVEGEEDAVGGGAGTGMGRAEAGRLSRERLERRARVEMERMTEVRSAGVSWLWPGRVALGALTLLAGDPGIGKSFVAMDLAARVSRGAAWPEEEESGRRVWTPAGDRPGGVLLICGEDGVTETIRPRLEAAGADLANIISVNMVNRYDEHEGEWARHPLALDNAEDLRAIDGAMREMAKRVPCRLVVIDPISAFMGDSDSGKPQAVRRVLTAFMRSVVEKHAVAVVAVMHLNKTGGSGALRRISGCNTFAAVARSAWLVAPMVEGGEGSAKPQAGAGEERAKLQAAGEGAGRRVMVPIKNNLASGVGGLAFTVRSPGVAFSGERMCARVEWERGKVKMTADEALLMKGQSEELRGWYGEASAWLKGTLADGPMGAREVILAAEKDGISKRTLERAKAELGVIAERAEKCGAWSWRMRDGAGGKFEVRMTNDETGGGESGGGVG